MTVKVVEIEGKKMLVNELTNDSYIKSLSTTSLIEELMTRDEWIETYILTREEYFNDCSMILHVAKENIPCKILVIKGV